MEEEQKTDVQAEPSDVTYGDYRKLGQPVDTVSGATQELLEVRPSGSSTQIDDSSATFKIIAIIAIISFITGIISSQIGVMP